MRQNPFATSFAARFGRGLLVAMLCFQAGSLMAQRSRITRPIDNLRRTRLPGHVNPNARVENDLGSLDGSEVIHSVSLVFRQSPEQQADLEKLLADQRDPPSPDYHRWLTPEDTAHASESTGTTLPGFVHGWRNGSHGDQRGAFAHRDILQRTQRRWKPRSALRCMATRSMAGGVTPTPLTSIPVALEGIVGSIHGLNNFGFKPRSAAVPPTPSRHTPRGRGITILVRAISPPSTM
jgi:hypothetical protein